MNVGYGTGLAASPASSGVGFARTECSGEGPCRTSSSSSGYRSQGADVNLGSVESGAPAPPMAESRYFPTRTKKTTAATWVGGRKDRVGPILYSEAGAPGRGRPTVLYTLAVVRVRHAQSRASTVGPMIGWGVCTSSLMNDKSMHLRRVEAVSMRNPPDVRTGAKRDEDHRERGRSS